MLLEAVLLSHGDERELGRACDTAVQKADQPAWCVCLSAQHARETTRVQSIIYSVVFIMTRTEYTAVSTDPILDGADFGRPLCSHLLLQPHLS